MSEPRKPRVVALGGGHGLAASLKAARLYAGDIAAIVSVADNGGSSGRLRKDYGVPAPGDLRTCLVALADPQSIWAKAFDLRFDSGELEGHAFGNLVITGLARSADDFEAALRESERLVGAVGRVLPATSQPVALKASVIPLDGEGEMVVDGQVAVANAARISRVSVVPDDSPASASALDALNHGDQILLGPGSLFTSVLAVAGVRNLNETLAKVSGQKVYVCNLRQQAHETMGLDPADHYRALLAHNVHPDVMLCDRAFAPDETISVPCVVTDLARKDGLAHDPAKLASALAGLL